VARDLKKGKEGPVRVSRRSRKDTSWSVRPPIRHLTSVFRWLAALAVTPDGKPYSRGFYVGLSRLLKNSTSNFPRPTSQIYLSTARLMIRHSCEIQNLAHHQSTQLPRSPNFKLKNKHSTPLFRPPTSHFSVSGANKQ
jgi:hypothetical protein